MAALDVQTVTATMYVGDAIDREALAAALDAQDVIQSEQWESYHADVLAEVMEPEDLQEWLSHLVALDLMLAAARAHLALLDRGRSRWLAFDIGCIECDEDSQPIGLFPTEEEARQAAAAARKRQKADWHGEHSLVVFDLAEFQ